MRGVIIVGSLILLLAQPASAEEPFPGAIQEAANIPCQPTCLLCHTDIPGNLANLRQPFGLAVFRSGAQRGKPESMRTVVVTLRDNKVDTDGDGKLDVDELAVGSNPNLADPKAELCGPEYGCGAQLAPQLPPARAPVMWWLVGILAVTALSIARRSRGPDGPPRLGRRR